MRRRDFIALLGGTATWPLAARAQQPAKVPRIGVLWHAANAEQEGTNYKAVVKGFADIGYIDGKSVVLEHRFPNEQPAQFRRHGRRTRGIRCRCPRRHRSQCSSLRKGSDKNGSNCFRSYA